MEQASTQRVVIVSTPAPDVADGIARALVTERLAACVTRIPGATSVYAWKGGIEQSEESLLFIKTDVRLVHECERLICELHPYEVPEIVSLPVGEIHAPYGAWLLASLRE